LHLRIEQQNHTKQEQNDANRNKEWRAFRTGKKLKEKQQMSLERYSPEQTNSKYQKKMVFWQQQKRKENRANNVYAKGKEKR